MRLLQSFVTTLLLNIGCGHAEVAQTDTGVFSTNKYSVSISLTVLERAVKKVSRRISTTTVRESSKREMNHNSGSFAGSLKIGMEKSGSFKLVSASAKAAFEISLSKSWKSITDVASSSKTVDSYESEDKLEFQDGTTQVYAVKTTIVTINNNVAEEREEINLGIRVVDNINGCGDVWRDGFRDSAWNDVMDMEPPANNSNRIFLEFEEKVPGKTGTAIIGVGTDYYLYERGHLQESWRKVPNSCCVRAFTQLNDGTFLGVGKSYYSLYTRHGLYSPWVGVPNSGSVVSVTQLDDGMIVGVGTNNHLLSRKNLSSNWVNVPDGCCVVAIDQLGDGTIIGVGTDYYLHTKENLFAKWDKVQHSGAVIGVAQLEDRTIVGVGFNNVLSTWSQGALGSKYWKHLPGSEYVIAVTSWKK